MKRIVIITLIALGIIPVFGEGLRERVYVHTDKDIYLSGELVWLKILTTTPACVPLDFSKVGYVELLAGTESKARASLQLADGTGSGTMLLPPDLQTGTYRLTAYTRYQQNESPEVFFEKIIGIVNPLNTEIPVPATADSGVPPFAGYAGVGQDNQSGIKLSISRPSFERRSPVEIKLENLPENIHTLSVSVTAASPMDTYPSAGLAEWKSTIPAALPLSEEVFAEYEGHIINGTITNSSGEPVSMIGAVPMVAMQGNDINVFVGKSDKDGSVAFQTRRANGYSEIVTTIAGTGADGSQLNIEQPFFPGHTSKPLPLLDLERIDKDLLLEQSIGMQVRYSYVADSLANFDYPFADFFHQPDYRFMMDEYRKFGTMGEVITEFVSFVQFRNVDGKRRLGVLRNEYGLKLNSLVLLDGIPVFDHDIIFNYNPLLLERIDVYLDQFVFGGLRYDGIVAMYTPNNSARELTPDSYTRIIPYEMPQAPRLFFSPDYSSPELKNSHLPDFRHTLYWNPDVKKESVTFFTSDLAGKYRIVVEGVTTDGRVVWATGEMNVN